MSADRDQVEGAPALKTCVLRRLRRFGRRDEATSDVEYILIVALVVIPLCLALPLFLVGTNIEFFDRVSLWVSLPFP